MKKFGKDKVDFMTSDYLFGKDKVDFMTSDYLFGIFKLFLQNVRIDR